MDAIYGECQNFHMIKSGLPKTLSKILNTKLISTFLVVFYFLFKYYPFQNWITYEYGSYILEVLVCVFAVMLFREQFNFKASLNIFLKYKSLFALNFLIGVALFSVEAMPEPYQITIPFNLSSLEVIFLLLVVGPCLEEFLFRFFLWSFWGQFLSQKRTLIITSFLFSLAHFYSYFFVPESYHIFIYYQSAYTFLLSLWWGRCYLSSDRNLAVPLSAHFFLNLGFYVGSLVVR